MGPRKGNIRMSKIEPIPGINWSAAAAACDAVDRIRDGDPPKEFLAMWINEAGQLFYSKTNLSVQGAALFAQYANAFVSRMVNNNLDS